MYLVHWKNRTTGATGHGTQPVSQETGFAWIEAMNEKYPDLWHWLEAA